MSGNNNFVLISPHTPCGFQSYFVRFFGSGFAGLKALVAVVCHIAACFAEAFLYCRNTFIRQFCVAVAGFWKAIHKAATSFVPFNQSTNDQLVGELIMQRDILQAKLIKKQLEEQK